MCDCSVGLLDSALSSKPFWFLSIVKRKEIVVQHIWLCKDEMMGKFLEVLVVSENIGFNCRYCALREVIVDWVLSCFQCFIIVSFLHKTKANIVWEHIKDDKLMQYIFVFGFFGHIYHDYSTVTTTTSAITGAMRYTTNIRAQDNRAYVQNIQVQHQQQWQRLVLSYICHWFRYKF